MTPFEGKHSYRPAEGHRLAHDPFNAIVAPRPIGWIGTRSADGIANLAPYSFFNALAYRPPTIGFSSEGRKDTLANVEATGVFTWNLATRRLAERMNATSAMVPPHVDEIELAGIAAIEGQVVAAPLVLESPAAFECRVSDIVRLRTAAGVDMNNWFVIGEVVAIHLDENVIVDGVYQTAAARPITRGGGPADYFEITEAAKFQMRRPA
ncbi:flavin reductase family protein [Sphingomonas sp. MMS24-J13]|uniref:flavin reductase family protein n=1 Tax=Sphingomonas sp. MMS24-J13 TaxID=3238686 RepID=UPI00384EE62E